MKQAAAGNTVRRRKRRSGEGKKGRFRPGLACMLAAAALLAAAGLAAGFAKSGGAAAGDGIVATVNGEPVTAAAFGIELGRQRASVMDHFRQVYGAEPDRHFWERSFEGVTPAGMLKERALESQVRTMLLIQEARSYGLAGEEGLDLSAERERENGRRLSAQREGRPVYGPLQFGEQEFAAFYAGRMAADLKAAMAVSSTDVSEAQLKRHYEDIKDPLFRLEDELVLRLVAVSYRDGGREEPEGRERARRELESLRAQEGGNGDQGQKVQREGKELAASGGQSEPALGGSGDPAVPLETGTATATVSETAFGTAAARLYYRSLPGLYAWLTGGARQGDVSPVFDDPAEGRYVYASVLAASPGGYRSYEEQRDNVRKHYMEGRLERRLDELRQEALIEKLPLYEELKPE